MSTGRRALIVLLTVATCGCSREIDAPQALPGAPVAPITAGQAGDLLSKEALRREDGNLFVTVDPDRCAGVAREVEAPFVFDRKPAAHSGGHWVATGTTDVFVEEIVGVYRATYDARAALADARRTIDSCRGTALTVSAMRGRTHTFSLLPHRDSGSPEILLWSFSAPTDWACDNALVAAHNAAIEITACAPANGFDVLTLADAALRRIDALANTTM